jgi:pyruvate,water dikinase
MLYFDGGVPGILERLEGSPSEDAKAFLDAFDTLLYDYGSHGPGEWDIQGEVWETRPELALGRLERMRFVPDGATITPAPPVARERARPNDLKVTNEIRGAIRELGRQMADAHHIADSDLVMMLTADELDGFVAHPQTYGLKLAERAREHAALAELDPPSVISGTVPPLSAWPRRTGRA